MLSRLRPFIKFCAVIFVIYALYQSFKDININKKFIEQFFTQIKQYEEVSNNKPNNKELNFSCGYKPILMKLNPHTKSWENYTNINDKTYNLLLGMNINEEKTLTDNQSYKLIDLEPKHSSTDRAHDFMIFDPPKNDNKQYKCGDTVTFKYTLIDSFKKVIEQGEKTVTISYSQNLPYIIFRGLADIKEASPRAIAAKGKYFLSLDNKPTKFWHFNFENYKDNLFILQLEVDQNHDGKSHNKSS